MPFAVLDDVTASATALPDAPCTSAVTSMLTQLAGVSRVVVATVLPGDGAVA